jgi:hypothetical protein
MICSDATPLVRRRLQPERCEHQDFVRHLRLRLPRTTFFFHPPMGGRRSAITGALMKSLGARAGMPDVMLIASGRVYGVELKAALWKNRRGEAIVVRLSEYEGHILIDQRNWFTAQDGTLKPGKGMACSVRHLPELAAALNKALIEARARGLLDAEAEVQSS